MGGAVAFGIGWLLIVIPAIVSALLWYLLLSERP